jgi:hypothetical protein
MMATQRIAVVVGVIVVVFAVCAALTFPGKSSPDVIFSYVGVSTSSNTNVISIAITNQSTLSIDYFVGNPVLKSNGVWGSFQCPTGTKLVRLGAGQAATGIITALSATGEAKVPVLWGFSYSPNASRWQEIREDVAAYFRMHDFRGRGALYTNYVAGIKL